MGAAASSEQTIEKLGFHVMHVQPSSPGEKAGLIANFDFIVAANNVPLNQDNATFKEILSNNIDKPVKLLVYNSRQDNTRETVIVPTNTWGGQGLVGLSIRFVNFESVSEHVWHVLDVYPRSPAVDAGLEARSDYIVGTPDTQFTDSEDFFAFVEANMKNAIRFYVYSSITDAVRIVTITPNNEWGGHGCLGCDIGYGYLHRIPKNPDSAVVSLDQTSSNVVGTSHASPTNTNAMPAVQTQQPSFVPSATAQRRLHPLMMPTATGYATPPATPEKPPNSSEVSTTTDASTYIPATEPQKLTFISVADEDRDVKVAPPPTAVPYQAGPARTNAAQSSIPPSTFVPQPVATQPTVVSSFAPQTTTAATTTTTTTTTATTPTDFSSTPTESLQRGNDSTPQSLQQQQQTQQEQQQPLQQQQEQHQQHQQIFHPHQQNHYSEETTQRLNHYNNNNKHNKNNNSHSNNNKNNINNTNTNNNNNSLHLFNNYLLVLMVNHLNKSHCNENE